MAGSERPADHRSRIRHSHYYSQMFNSVDNVLRMIGGGPGEDLNGIVRDTGLQDERVETDVSYCGDPLVVRSPPILALGGLGTTSGAYCSRSVSTLIRYRPEGLSPIVVPSRSHSGLLPSPGPPLVHDIVHRTFFSEYFMPYLKITRAG